MNTKSSLWGWFFSGWMFWCGVLSTGSVSAAVNDAPSISAPGSISVTEDVAEALTGISFADPDAASASVTATFSVGTGSLSATSGGGVTAGGSGTTGLTLSGSITSLNSFLSASNVTFLTATNAYTNVFLTVIIDDGGNTGTGGALTGTNSVILTVAPVDDPPSVTTSGGSTAFLEGNNTPPSPVVVDSGLITANPEAATLSSAMVAISASFVAGQDSLEFANDGSTMGNITGSYDSGLGVLTLNSAGATATTAQWQAALRTVTYSNSSEAPNETARTIRFIVYDGPEVSAPATRTVTVTATNDTPQIINLDTNSVTFTENGPAVALDALGDALVTDVDFTTFNGGYLQVAISLGLVSAQDVLAFSTNGGLALSAGMTAGSTVSVNGTNVGTVISSGASGENLIVHWNLATTTNAAEALLRSLVYTNLSDTPTTNARSVYVEIADGVNSLGVATVSLSVVATDDVPTVTMSGGATTFIEGADMVSTPVVVDGGMQVNDPDDTTLVQATVDISGSFVSAEDGLSFSNDGSTMGNIGGSYVPGIGLLSLTSAGSTATLAQWQSALRSVTYVNNSDSPTTNSRAVTVIVQSGPLISVVATRAVVVIATNDTPQLAGLDGDVVTFTEAGAAVALDTGGDALVIDPDAEPFTSGFLDISITNLTSADDTLFFDLIGGVQLPFGATNGAPVRVSGTTVGTLSALGQGGAHLAVALNSNAVPALVQALVRAVSFTNSSPTPVTTNRTIVVLLMDSGGALASANVTLGVTGVNDAPTIAPPASFGITEHTYFVIPAFTVADADAGTNELLVTLELSLGGLSTTVLPFPGVVANGTNAVSRIRGTAAAINNFLIGETNFLALVSDDSTTNVTLTIGISDGGFTGAGGMGTNHAIVALTLTLVNDEPVMLAWSGTTNTYFENSAPVFMNAGQNGTITDPDSADFAGGLLLADIVGGGQLAEDVLSFDTNGVVTLSAALTLGSSVGVSNVVIGTITASGSDGEALTVALNTNATPARVQALARALTYENLSEAPTETLRNVLFALSDGDGGTNLVAIYVDVRGVNDTPGFTLTVGHLQTNSASVVAWGANDSGQTNLPSGLGDVAAISAGFEHALALRTDGTVVAWGLNDDGQTNVPPGLTNVAAIAAGTYHSMALLSNGTVVAWGKNEYGVTNAPPDLTNAVAIAAGGQISAAVRADGTLALWGLASYPPSNLTGVRDIAFGGNHGVVLFTNGTVQTYGSDFLGQLNQPGGLTGVRAIAAGNFHSVALHSNGTVSAWGYNGSEQSTPPDHLTNIVAIGATGFGGLAVRDDGSLVAWGTATLNATAPSLTKVFDVSGGTMFALARVAELLQPITVAEDSGAFTLTGAATNITVGPAAEASQTVTFVVTAADTNLFSVQPGISASGTLTFTPAPNAYGTTTVSVVVMDNGGTANGGDDMSDAQWFILRIESVEDAPVAVADAYSVAEDTILHHFAVSGVLANDVDGDDEPLGASLVTDVTQGVLDLTVTGSFSYDPAPDFYGTDSFQYQATNSSGTSAVVTVTLTVTPVNDAPHVYPPAVTAIPGSVQALNGIMIDDREVGTNLVSLEIVFSDGSLSAISYGGTTPVTNALNPRFVRLVGSISNLTTYLDYGAMLFHLPGNITTNLTYTVTLDDHGHTGTDPGDTGTATNEVAVETSEILIIPYSPRVVLPPLGYYGAGDALDFTIQMSEPVTVNTNGGVPDLEVLVGATQRLAVYRSGSGTTNLVFRYTVQPGDRSTALYVSLLVRFGGATIEDAEGNAFAGFIAQPPTDGIIVDGVEPQVLSLLAVPPGWNSLGAELDFDVLFTEDIAVGTNGGLPRLALTLDSTNAHASYVSGSGSNILTFRYVVRNGDMATNGIILTRLIDLNGGTLRDLAGNNALLDFGSNMLLSGVLVDTTPPIAHADAFAPIEDEVFDGTSVLLNDSYARADLLTATLVRSTTNGALSFNIDGTFSYTPATNFTGADSFTYIATDGTLTSAVATVTLTLQPVNDPPTITGPTILKITNSIPSPILGLTVGDVDAGTNQVEIYFFSVGTITATNSSGVIVSNVNHPIFGMLLSSVRLSGTISSLNTYLASTNVFFQSSIPPQTPSGILVEIDDQGHSGMDPGTSGSSNLTAMTLILIDNSTINDNPGIMVELPNQTGSFGVPFSFTFATNVFIDPDGDPLRYSAAGLPPGIAFNAATRTFAGTPTAAGEYTVRAIAGDGRSPELRATNTFTFTIEKASLTIIANDQSRPCGAANPAFTFTYEGFLGADTRAVLDTPPVANTEANAVSPPDRYPITLTGGSDNNYDFRLIDGMLTVTNSDAPATATLRGVYHGLFYETNVVRHESSGAFLITATAAGAYSGTLELAGAKLRLSGAFTSSRGTTNVITRKALPPLTLVLRLDDCDPPQAIYGSVSDGSWSAELDGTPLHFHAKTNPAPYAGRYTMLMASTHSAPAIPRGTSWGTFTIATSGMLKLVGSLSDGTKLSDASAVNEAGLWPLYLPYARNGGSIIGWLSATNEDVEKWVGYLSCIKKARLPTTKYYAAGFTNEAFATGIRYIPPGKGTNVVSWTNGLAFAVDGNLAEEITNRFDIGLVNRVAWEGTNFTALSFTSKDGRFKGTFKHPAIGKPTSFSGVLHQPYGRGAGFFLGTNQSGAINIEPVP